jgi:hypothetical protein
VACVLACIKAIIVLLACNKLLECSKLLPLAGAVEAAVSMVVGGGGGGGGNLHVDL